MCLRRTAVGGESSVRDRDDRAMGAGIVGRGIRGDRSGRHRVGTQRSQAMYSGVYSLGGTLAFNVHGFVSDGVLYERPEERSGARGEVRDSLSVVPDPVAASVGWPRTKKLWIWWLMNLGNRIGRWLSHTRFVPTPLYRLVLIAAGISAILQLAFGAPESVTATAQACWFDWMFVVFQLIGAVCAITGLYLVEGENPVPWAVSPAHPPDIDPERLHRSLTLELLGLIFLQTCMAIQIVSTINYNGRPPSALSTWIAIVFWAWSFFRDRDIIRALKKLTR